MKIVFVLFALIFSLLIMFYGIAIETCGKYMTE